ncbi:MAG: ribosomal-protein-alanine N-acetyltransferase, partial [Flavobacteriales bacterium]
MLKTKIFDKDNKPTQIEKDTLVDFLFTSLEEYGDPKADIEKAINYALNEFTSFGGFTMLLEEDEILKAAVVINQTGMG